MPIDVEFGGQVHQFPDDATDAEIASALEALSPKQATPPPPSATIGMLAPSTVQGDPAPERNAGIGNERVRGWMNQMDQRSGELRQEAAEHPIRTAAMIAAPTVLSKAPGILARAAGISATRGGQNVRAGIEAAKNVSVNVEQPGRVGVEMLDYQGIETIPRAAQSFMRRITDPTKGDLLVEEAQRYMSSLGRISTGEFNKLTPNMQRQVAAMSKALRESLVEATGGQGGQYARGVREYARAGKAAKYGKVAAKWGGGAVGGALSARYILDRITDALRPTQ